MDYQYKTLIGDKYRALQEAEQRAFQSAPLLLGGGKKLLQVFVLPPATALAATHLPIAGPVVAGAVGQATHWVHSGIHDTVANHLTNQFAEMSKNIQPGFMHWARQRAFDDWTKVRIPDMLAKTDLWARPLSGTIAPSLIGRSMIDTGKLAISFATKGIPTVVSRPIVHLWRQTSQVIHRTQAWLKQTLSELPQQVQQNVRSAIDNIQRRKPAMADELNQAPTERDIDNRAAYVRLLSEANINDPPLTYERIQENIQDSPDLGANYDKQVTYQALTAGKTLDEATAIISQGPNVAQMSEANLQDVSVYLSETTNSVWNQYNTQNPSPAVNQGQSLEPESPTVADSRPQEQSQPRGIDWARQVAFDTVSRPVNRLATSFMDTGKQAIGYTTQSAARVATLPLTYMRDMTQKVINRAQAWFEETLNKLPESVQQNVRSVIGNMQGRETAMAEEIDQNQQPIQDSVVSEAQTVAESNGVVAEPSVEVDEIQGESLNEDPDAQAVAESNGIVAESPIEVDEAQDQSLDPEPETVLSQDDTVVELTDQLDPEQDQSAQLQDEFEVPQDPLLDEQGTQLEADASERQELSSNLDPEVPTVVEANGAAPPPPPEDDEREQSEKPDPDDQAVAESNGIIDNPLDPKLQEQYIQLLSESLEEPDLTWDEVQERVNKDPVLAWQFDEKVAFKADENDMKPDEVRKLLNNAPEWDGVDRSKPAAAVDPEKPGLTDDNLEAYRMIKEDVLDQLVRFNSDLGNLSINLNGERLMGLGREGSIMENKTSLTTEQAQLIRDALQNPKDHKDVEITIKLGTRVAFRLKNGVAQPDKFGIVKAAEEMSAKIPKATPEQIENLTKEQKGVIEDLKKQGLPTENIINQMVDRTQTNKPTVPKTEDREVAMSR